MAVGSEPVQVNRLPTITLPSRSWSRNEGDSPPAARRYPPPFWPVTKLLRNSNAIGALRGMFTTIATPVWVSTTVVPSTTRRLPAGRLDGIGGAPSPARQKPAVTSEPAQLHAEPTLPFGQAARQSGSAAAEQDRGHMPSAGPQGTGAYPHWWERHASAVSTS